jgi:hypothetical protein
MLSTRCPELLFIRSASLAHHELKENFQRELQQDDQPKGINPQLRLFLSQNEYSSLQFSTNSASANPSQRRVLQVLANATIKLTLSADDAVRSSTKKFVAFSV